MRSWHLSLDQKFYLLFKIVGIWSVALYKLYMVHTEKSIDLNEHEKTCGTTKISSSSCVVWYWAGAVLKIPFFERSNLRESGSKTSMHGGSMLYTTV